MKKTSIIHLFIHYLVIIYTPLYIMWLWLGYVRFFATIQQSEFLFA